MPKEQYRDWFEKKLSRSGKASLKSETVSATFKKPLGPRGYYADVTISVREAETFSFVSKADWKDFDNYDEAVLDGVLTVLFTQKSTPILSGAFTLEQVGWHEIDSCYEAFFQAAKRATQEILRRNGYWE